ncbi:MAG TPA: MarR family transcriptional regulator [Reyranella sp.]|nr:MarR family transcriptional regulator [Reyranella sp.]
MAKKGTPHEIFAFFNEIGIIAQLSATLFNRSLPDGLSVAHFSILNHMVRLGDGRTPLQLASAFQVTKATMSHSLDVLSRRGFVRLEKHPDDGRSKLVFLTKAGRTFRDKAIEKVTGGLAGLMGDLDANALATLLPQLRAVREVLDRNR